MTTRPLAPRVTGTTIGLQHFVKSALGGPKSVTPSILAKETDVCLLTPFFSVTSGHLQFRRRPSIISSTQSLRNVSPFGCAGAELPCHLVTLDHTRSSTRTNCQSSLTNWVPPEFELSPPHLGTISKNNEGYSLVQQTSTNYLGFLRRRHTPTTKLLIEILFYPVTYARSFIRTASIRSYTILDFSR